VSALPTVEELADIQRIIRLQAKYARFVDLKRWLDLEALLTDDFEFEGASSTRGAAVFVSQVSRRLANENTVHELHTPEIEIQLPCVATGTWPFADLIDERRDGLGVCRRGFGHYTESYVKTADGWRISTMRVARLRVDCTLALREQEPIHHACYSEEEVLAWLGRHGAQS